MMLPLMLATMALKAGAAAAGAGANNDLVNMVFPALAMGMALWGTALLAWLAPRLARFHAQFPAVALRLTAAVHGMDTVWEGHDLEIRYGHDHASGLSSQQCGGCEKGA